MTREEYLKINKQNSKDLIKKIIEIFYVYDGDFTKIGEAISKSKSRVSALLKSDLINEMISDGEINKEDLKKIREMIEKNKNLGRKKGGDNFIKNNEVIMENNRIVGHRKK